MLMDSFGYYLVIANILGFIFFAINIWLCQNTKNGQINWVLTITALAGGALGIMLGILIIDRKARKENMMSRVFVICILIIQVIVFLMLKGMHKEKLTFDFISFFGRHKPLMIYLVIINIVTLIAFGIDKIKAVSHKSRIRIITLLGLAFVGGSLGGLSGMYLFRHKINKNYFSAGIPLVIIMQTVVIFFLMNLE